MHAVITSFATKAAAQKFAKALLAQKLAACCSLFPGAISFYHWKGKDVTAKEVFLLIKTTAPKINALKKFFKNNHPYELPEFFSLKVNPSAEFGAWIKSQVN